LYEKGGITIISATVGDLYDRCVTFYRDRVAIKFNDSSYTFSHLGQGAYRLAGAFNHMGFKKGDRVAFLMANCPEYIFCEYALAKIGVVRVPLAVLLNSTDHVYMINQSRCTALIYHASMASRVREMIPQLETIRHFICIGEDASGVMRGHIHLQDLISGHSFEVPPVKVSPEDLCGIYYTGGTTGRPKGVMLSHRSWVSTFLTEMLELGLGYDEVFAYATPLTHAGGCLILPVLLKRGTCVILDHFDPGIFLEATQREKVTAAFMVPTMIYVLLDYPELRKYDFTSWIWRWISRLPGS